MFSLLLHNKSIFKLVKNFIMKKILHLVPVLILMMVAEYASSQTYYTSTSNSTNIFPFQTTSSNKIQWLFYNSDFNTPMPAGNITRLYIQPNSSATTTYTNLTIKMGTTSITAMTTGPWVAGLTTVYTATSTTIVAVSGNWFYIDLQTPFYYNGTSNLVVEISQTAYSGSGFTLPQNGSNGNRRMYGSVASATGTQSTGLPIFGFNMAPNNCSGIPTPGTIASAQNTIDCADSTTLTLSGQTLAGNIAYQWQYNTGIGWTNFGTSSTTVTTPAIFGPTQFRAQVTCTATGGGSAFTPVITLNVLPFVNFLAQDTVLCPGSNFNVSAGNPGSTYLWSNSATTQSINISNPGTYSVLVTKANGCIGKDTINVAAGSFPTNNLPMDVDLCEGDSFVLDAGNAGSTYNWSTAENTQSITVDTGGTYSVTITNQQHCVSTFSTSITSRPDPVVNLGNDTAICNNTFMTLDAGNPGLTYLWNSGDTTQTISTVDSGTYSVVVTSPYNCEGTDAIHVAFNDVAYTGGFNFVPLIQQSNGLIQFEPINPMYVYDYYWDFGDGDTSTLMNPTHQYATSGNYLVKLKVQNDCGWTEESLLIEVDLLTTSVRKITSVVDLSVYPNPSNGLLNIKGKSGDIKINQVRVINSLGQTVISKTLSGNNAEQLALQQVAAGHYLLQIETNRGTSIKKIDIVK